MRKTEIPSPGGYMIPLDADIRVGEKLACIISHGFASSRKSTTAQTMMAHCRSMGMASVAFDWVCHGESRAHYSRLTVDACLDDLAAVERWISLQLPDAEIVYFGSSFGAYLDICHICSGQPRPPRFSAQRRRRYGCQLRRKDAGGHGRHRAGWIL